MPENPSPDKLPDAPMPPRSKLLTSEDWWAVWIGGAILLAVLAATWAYASARPNRLQQQADTVAQHKRQISDLRAEYLLIEKKSENDSRLSDLRGQLKKLQKEYDKARVAINPIAPYVAKPGSWKSNPLDAIYVPKKHFYLIGVLGVFSIALVVFGIGRHVLGTPLSKFATGFVVVFLLAILAYILAGQQVVKQYNLEYALWALFIGLLISNTIGTPEFIKPAICTEFYIKTGLVLLGAGILFTRLLALGVPGVCVAWVVTPIVLITTYWFGQRVLKIPSRSLNMVVSADMSVCGVSAAIATAAACRAKKEELSLAVGMSLTFTVIMMVLMPWLVRAVGMSDVLGGAWIGGTIDATGAVAAAGELLSESALKVATTVKLIQNILIGVIAFSVALYWVQRVERDTSDVRPNAMEIWHRFPKFVIGFVAASILFSVVYSMVDHGNLLVDAVIRGTTKTLRGWFFCLAFVSIGLETNFRELAQQLKGGRPLLLYVCGQSLNLCLTLAMAWLMFEVIFAEQVQQLLK